MTTEPMSDDDRAARLEALQRRRAAARPALRSGPAEPSTATPATGRRARRRHAAMGGRILAGSLSAAAALGLVGAMAHVAGASTETSTTGTGDAAAVPTVIVIHRPAGASAAARAAPHVTPTTAAPVATSRGS